MPTLHDEAASGTLTAQSLENYLRADPALIDSQGGPKKLTPLAIAVSEGQLDVVKLLLDNPTRKANPNARSRGNRAPLYYATTRAKSKQLEIVRALLDAGADINKCGDDANEYTPLMNAISQLRNEDVVHLFVDRGADQSPTRKNETAASLAKAAGMEKALLPASQRKPDRGPVVNMILAIVNMTIAFANAVGKPVLDTVSKIGGTRFMPKAVVSGVKNFGKTFANSVKAIANAFGGKSGGGGQDPGNGQTPGAPDDDDESPLAMQRHFMDAMDDFVGQNDLNRFFPKGSSFLKDLAAKAFELSSDKSTDLGSPENLPKLLRLSLHQPVIYCDDSGSMDEKDGTQTTRFEKLRDLVTRITRVATKLMPDDLDVAVRFINDEKGITESSVDAIEKFMGSVSPGGGTELGGSLHSKVLVPMVYDNLSTATGLSRPLLVCTITDGEPSGEATDTFRRKLHECGEKLRDANYQSSAVQFSISQIGTSGSAAGFLKDLRDDASLSKVLYCTSDRVDAQFDKLRDNERDFEVYLLDLLTRPIMQAK